MTTKNSPLSALKAQADKIAAMLKDKEQAKHYQAPFIHYPGDDDSSAVTFWGKRDLRVVLRKALAELDAFYTARGH